MASVVTGVRDAIEAVRQRFGWADPVLVAWAVTVGAVLLGAELFNQDYDMLIATLRIIFYFTLFELIIGIPDQQTDTPNTEQLFSLFSALGAGGLGFTIEVAAGALAGDMTASQLLGLGMLNSRIYANYSTTEMTLREAVWGEGPVTHPYMTITALMAVLLPFLLKLFVFLFGKTLAPQVRSPSTFVLVSTTAATTGFVVYYLGSGLSWGRITGSDRGDGRDRGNGNDGRDGSAEPTESVPEPEVATTDPRRTESGFTFPAEQDAGQSGQSKQESDPENPVADHPVARQSSGERSR